MIVRSGGWSGPIELLEEEEFVGTDAVRKARGTGEVWFHNNLVQFVHKWKLSS